MTGMYKEIELKLWKKDILRLEKKHEDTVLTEDSLKRAGRRKIERFVKDELAFIESLAFTGLHNSVVEFTSEQLKRISDHFTPSVLPNKTLPSLSFLRTSDPSSEYRYQNYHFIHLTFQEYFAARYFTRQWTDPKAQLQFLTFSSTGTETTAYSPTKFLQQHKYTARYNIFWRFVAGLLNENGQALDFMHTIEEEPLDLLGPAHQRLAMHCLSEISNGLPTWEALEQRLARWLLFECTFNRSASLASEVEFPEAALQAALLDETSGIQTTILRSLASRAVIPRGIAKAVVRRLDDVDHDVREAAIEALHRQASLPDEVIMSVMERLDDTNVSMRSAAVAVLHGRARLPNEVLGGMVRRLNDQYAIIRVAAIEALGARMVVPDTVLVAMSGRLEDKEWDVRRAAVEAIGWRASLPDQVLVAVAACLNDKDQHVREVTVEVLSRREALPDEVLTAVVARLDDEGKDVREAAVYALGRRTALPDTVLTAVAACIDDENEHVRSAAVYALGRRTALPDTVLTAVAARLDDKDENVRKAAVKALGKRAALPSEVLAAVVGRLEDNDEGVREAAVKVLGGRVALAYPVLVAVAARLNDENEHVREAAVYALGRRTALPDTVLTAVAACLDDSDEYVREAAVEALGRPVSLPSEVLAAVVGRLEDNDEGVRATAVKFLGRRVALPDPVLVAVAARLDDIDSTVRKFAVETLGNQATLPDELLVAVVARLNDEQWYVREAAVDVLMRRHKNCSHIILDQPLIASFYTILLKRSFKEQLSCYIVEDSFCVNMPGGIRNFPIYRQLNDVREWLHEARPTYQPSIVDGDGFGGRSSPEDAISITLGASGKLHFDRRGQSKQLSRLGNRTGVRKTKPQKQRKHLHTSSQLSTLISEEMKHGGAHIEDKNEEFRLLADFKASETATLRNIALVDESCAKHEAEQSLDSNATVIDTFSITDGVNLQTSIYANGYPYHRSKLLELVFPILAVLRTEPAVSPGKIRVRWTCTCGEDLYDDFTEVIAGSLIGLQERLPTRASTEPSTKLSSIATKIGQSLRQYVNGIDPFLERIAERIRHLRRRPTRLPLHSEAGGIVQIQQRSGSSSTEDSLILLLCIGMGVRRIQLYQDHLQNVHDDNTLFQFLRSQSSQHRSRLSWLSFRGVSKISLTQFHVDANMFAEIHHHDVICNNNCSCLPPLERVQANEYRCNPAPETNPGYFPPIGTNALTHYFRNPHAFKTMQKTIFNQIPKRAQGPLRISPDECQLGWGIYIAEGWNWRWIYFIIVVPLLIGGFIFGIAWSVTKGDIQSAFAITGTWMALAPVLLSYVAARDLS